MNKDEIKALSERALKMLEEQKAEREPIIFDEIGEWTHEIQELVLERMAQRKLREQHNDKT